MPFYRFPIETADHDAHVRIRDWMSADGPSPGGDRAEMAGADLIASNATDITHPYHAHGESGGLLDGTGDLYSTWITLRAPDDERASSAIHLLVALARSLDPNAERGKTMRADRLRAVTVTAPHGLGHRGPREETDLGRKLTWVAYRFGAWEVQPVGYLDDQVILTCHVAHNRAATRIPEMFRVVCEFDGRPPLVEGAVTVTSTDDPLINTRHLTVEDPVLPPADAAQLLSTLLDLTPDSGIKSATVRDWLRNGRSPVGPLSGEWVGRMRCLRRSAVLTLAERLRAKGWQLGQVGRPAKDH